MCITPMTTPTSRIRIFVNTLWNSNNAKGRKYIVANLNNTRKLYFQLTKGDCKKRKITAVSSAVIMQHLPTHDEKNQPKGVTII